ncbi:MAG: hypothetical protein M1819_006357 [Sarea resinae]|nr:MAG: hypothetical protein M1819_006357 [Sarea resinae]
MADEQAAENITADTPVESNGSPSFDETPAVNSPAPDESSALAPVDESAKLVENVLYSDIGVTTLLSRLKQSIASARDFSTFLKKRSSLEEEHAQGLKKLCKSTHDSIKRPESRGGSYASQYNEITRIHERMAENGMQFALSLHQMHDDLGDLSSSMDRQRKQLKQTGLNAEKRVSDAESLMEKAKAKYDSLAEDYDRVRTGDRQSGKKFGLKGPKSAAQQEEDLHRKVQGADADYASKVQSAQGLRQELLTTLRPQTIKALQALITECDSALTLQLAKFASFNEKLLLSNGLCVSPLKSQEAQGPTTASIREAVSRIDNERDLRNYISSFTPKVPPKRGDIKYERHPSLAPAQQTPSSANRQSMTLNQAAAPPFSVHAPPHDPAQGNTAPTQGPDSHYPTEKGDLGSPTQSPFPPASNNGPLHLVDHEAVSQIPPRPLQPAGGPAGGQTSGITYSDLPPLKPVFGVSLDELYRRDSSAVPMIVYQCLQAIDLFGLEMEGIYRLSGTASHIAKLKSMFDNDSSQVDFRNPESFFHDVNSVAGLLKQFFRDLPDPLLTAEHYVEFINAARIDDDIIRRDSLHAIINSLPDPNYATLRALTLHLNRVQEHSQANRMTAGNLAICFGPTLMGSDTGPNIADAGWQVRVIDTILQNTYQIFDED